MSSCSSFRLPQYGPAVSRFSRGTAGRVRGGAGLAVEDRSCASPSPCRIFQSEFTHPGETPRRNDGALEKPAGVRARFPLVTLIDREPLQEIPGETLGGAAGAESSRHIEDTRGRAR